MNKDLLLREDVLTLINNSIDLEMLFPDGFDYLYFESIDSTNKYAKENCDRFDNAVITAEDQYAGVGKNASKWFAKPHRSLITTIVLSKDIKIDRIGILPLFIGAAIHDVLKDYGIDTFIKWPNDIYLDDKKLLGILCESVIREGRVKKLIIGIGINVNQSADELPLDGSISLYSYTGRRFDRRKLLADILVSVFSKINDISYIDKYSKDTVNRYLYLKNKDIVFVADKPYSGKLLGINEKGEIVIETGDGKKAFSSGKIIV